MRDRRNVETLMIADGEAGAGDEVEHPAAPATGIYTHGERGEAGSCCHDRHAQVDMSTEPTVKHPDIAVHFPKPARAEVESMKGKLETLFLSFL